MSDLSQVDTNRIIQLKKAYERVAAKREKKIISRLVSEHRDGALTQEKAYATIMMIAELRSAGNDIGSDDL